VTPQTVVAVVDNEPSMRRSIVRLLGVNGFAARDYPSAEAFLDCRAASEAACLVLDVHLDGMSGFELGRRLKASGSQLPVIFITAADDEATESRAMELGCIAFLQKPFAPNALIGLIAKASDWRQPAC
jgi:FixJ family two-component response regulator